MLSRPNADMNFCFRKLVLAYLNKNPTSFKHFVAWKFHQSLLGPRTEVNKTSCRIKATKKKKIQTDCWFYLQWQRVGQQRYICDVTWHHKTSLTFASCAHARCCVDGVTKQAIVWRRYADYAGNDWTRVDAWNKEVPHRRQIRVENCATLEPMKADGVVDTVSSKCLCLPMRSSTTNCWIPHVDETVRL